MFPDVSSLRDQLTDSLNQYSEALTQADVAIRNANSLFNSIDDIDAKNSIERFVNQWISQLCEQFTSLSDNPTHIEISQSSLSSDFSRFQFPHDLRAWDMPVDVLVNHVLTQFDFDALAHQLTSRAKSLKTKGFEDAAKKLIYAFNLKSYDHKHNDLIIKRVTDRFVLERRHYGRAYERAREVLALIDAANTMGNETGTYGLMRCFKALEEAEDSCSYYQHIPSRTPINKNDSVSLTYFNEVEKFYFKEDEIMSLIGFVRTYGGADIRPITLA